MMIIFKSNWDVPWATAKRGFRASIVAGMNGLVCLDMKRTIVMSVATYVNINQCRFQLVSILETK